MSKNLINFYRHVQNSPSALVAELRGFLHSREDFRCLVSREPHTQLDAAATWYWLQVSSFGGKGLHFGRSRDSFAGLDLDAVSPRVFELHRRIRDVLFRCADACDIIREFDSPDTFFFCDPPYIACSKTAYDAFSEADMARVRDALAQCAGKWLLTCDDSPAARRVFAGFHVRQNSIKYTLSKNKSGKVSGELLVFSDNLARDHPGETSVLFNPSRGLILDFPTSQNKEKSAG